MRKVMIMVILSMVAWVSFAHAQTKTFTGSLLNPDRNGPFVITLTEERASSGGVELVTKTRTIWWGIGPLRPHA